MNVSKQLTIVTVLVALLAFSLAGPVARAQGQTVVVEGQVVNGTDGGGSVAGLTVILYQQGPNVSNQVPTTTDDEGRFRFEDVEFDPETGYGVEVTYQGAFYGTDIDLSTGSPPPMTLQVFDAADSLDLLSVASASTLFSGYDNTTGTISALEIVTITNDTDRTFVPGSEPMGMVRFGLPPGAQGLQVETPLPDADYLQINVGFALIVNIPPGQYDVMYAYQFPYTGNSASVAKSLQLGAESLRILAPMGAMDLASEDLGVTKSVTIGESPYLLLEASNLEKGSRVEYELGGLSDPSLGAGGTASTVPARPGGALNPRDDGTIRFEYAAPAGLGVLMAVIIGYAIWNRTLRRTGAPVVDSEALTADDERAVLQDMLDELDDRLDDGTLTRDEYRRRRAALRNRLTSRR